MRRSSLTSILVAVVFGLSLPVSPAVAFGTGTGPTAPPPPSMGFGFSIPGSSDSILSRPDSPADRGGLPQVHRDLSTLPPPVAAMRQKIIDAARSADYLRLQAVIGLSDPPPVFSSREEGDPVEVLRSGSGDEEGLEILAILLDVLDAGWVVRDEGSAQARYIWPYFAEFPPDALGPEQLVEAYRVLTAGDMAQMRAIGNYEFYRVELAADGRWLLFMSGE